MKKKIAIAAFLIIGLVTIFYTLTRTNVVAGTKNEGNTETFHHQKDSTGGAEGEAFDPEDPVDDKPPARPILPTEEYVTSRSPEEDLTAITRPVLPEDSEESPIEVEYEPPSVIETNEEVNKTTENKTDSKDSSKKDKSKVDTTQANLTPEELKPEELRMKLQDLKNSEEKRIVLIGAGPTNLGVLYRLYDLGYNSFPNVQIIVLEQEHEAGGLASSRRDEKGFLWDNGGHVVFSHYKYFTNTLNTAIADWNERKRASFAFMKGADNKRRYIPYPVQNSIQYMDEKFQNECLKGLEEAKANTSTTIRNFDDWLLKNFGEGLCNIFMRKYNRKVWTVKSTEMNSAWVGERVAVPDIEEIKKKIADAKNDKLEDAAWGPNRMFTFPKYGGTGGIWIGVAELMPRGWFHYGHKVIGIDVDKKELKIKKSGESYSLGYDLLINTTPMDLLIDKAAVYNNKAKKLKKSTDRLIFSHTHVIGLGLTGKPPPHLQDKSWIYFPDSDSPFYRATVFSSYADDNVPNEKTDKYWSLMCEAAQPKADHNTTYWSEANLIEETIKAMVLYGYIKRDKVVSKYYYQLDHGYPVPSIARDGIIKEVQPWLESKSIYSRGRFGGWKYEVGNQDHSFMQGVELADLLALSIPEETYPDPGFVNAMKATNRTLPFTTSKGMDYEFAYFFQMNTGFDQKMLQHAGHTHMYHRGLGVVPDFRFRMWKNLPKVGGEVYGYLYHIVHNYDCLADVTVFMQPPKPLTESRQCYSDPKQYVNEAKKKGFSTKSLKPFKPLGESGPPRFKTIVKASQLSFGEYWEYVFGTKVKKNLHWSPSVCFGVTRERIHRHPKSFYQRVLLSVSHNPNPQEADYVKKLWVSMFSG